MAPGGAVAGVWWVLVDAGGGVGLAGEPGHGEAFGAAGQAVGQGADVGDEGGFVEAEVVGVEGDGVGFPPAVGLVLGVLLGGDGGGGHQRVAGVRSGSLRPMGWQPRPRPDRWQIQPSIGPWSGVRGR